MQTFAESGLRAELLKAVAEIGFVDPTPIQQQAIPHLLNTDRDLIAFAQTGTGKTAAFGLPCIHKTNVDDRSTQTIILCPTRELCIQITNDLQAFSKYLNGLSVLAVYGGSSIEGQIRSLKRGVQIVVGTPGRTVDLIKRRKLQLGNVTRVVLDEADEMLSMGFTEDLEFILAQTPEAKQTLLFSATMSKEMKNVTKKYMHDPERISVAAQNKAADTVEHLYYMVHSRDRYEALKRIADMNPNIYGIIFCRTRRETKEVASKLMHDDYSADAIHGDLSQSQRDEVMGKFRGRALQLLVATDVAARGLDVNDLTHVINFNLPDDSQNYVHRSGRTGRAGKSGVSIAIIHTREGRKIAEIERTAGIKFKKENVPTGQEVCSKQLFALVDKIENIEVNESQIGPFLPEVYAKLSWLDREQLIKHFVSAEFNRFLSYYKGARDLNVSERGRERTERERQQPRTFAQFYLNLGFKNHLNPAKVIGLVNETLDSNQAAIGKIDVQKKYTLFEVEEKYMTAILSKMNGKKFGGTTIQVEMTDTRTEYPTQRRSGGKGGGKGKGRSNRSSSGKHRKGGGKKKKYRG